MKGKETEREGERDWYTEHWTKDFVFNTFSWPLRATKRHVLFVSVFSPLSLSLSLVSGCFLGDSCGMQGGVFSYWWHAKTSTLPLKPSSWKTFSSMSNLKSAVLEQHPIAVTASSHRSYNIRKSISWFCSALRGIKAERETWHDHLVLQNSTPPFSL